MRPVCLQSFHLFRCGTVFLLLLVHVLPFTMLLGSMLAFNLSMLGRLLPVTQRFLQLAEMLRFILLAQVGMLSV